MNRWALLRMDIQFQYRHGFYWVYLLVSILYAWLLHTLPEAYQAKGSVFILFTDPAFLGAFFIGAILLLEREQDILRNLSVTPLTLSQYLTSKVLSLALLALASSFAILLPIYHLQFNVLPLLAGVGLTSILSTLLGLILAVRSRHLVSYLFSSPIFAIPMYLPVIFFFWKSPSAWWINLLPGTASLTLIQGGFQSLHPTQLFFSILILIGWILPFWYWAAHAFRAHILLRFGGKLP
ncbi:hypothetical protein [Marininema halotolerans]|nr:hypothetical protein [Marininema halotolerans]